ncbi:MAG: hypothetical protein NTX59_00875 [Elusimicrobia bacterium]|nr:hypothetical protein [Elusimicrobiota bacterium]
MKNNNSVRGYVLLAVMVLSAGQSASAGVNFDQGVDVGSFIKEAAASDIKAPEARSAFPTDITRDCKKVTFTQADPLASAEIPLLSRETGQDCINYGYPVGQICTPIFKDYTANAKIVITAPRELKPGQKEVFEVCLWGSFLDMRPVSTVYKYSVNRVLNVFQITPQGTVQAGNAKSAEELCMLAMDTANSCIYQCKDGSFLSKPNPFPGLNTDIPFHGCRPSTPKF